MSTPNGRSKQPDPHREDGRTRRKLMTMRRIQLTALSLFERHGFDGVTIEDIARAAHVGPATVYRNFATKERIVLWDEYDPLLVQGVAARLGGESILAATRDALIAGLDAVYRRDRERILRRMRVLAAAPALQAEVAQNLAELRAALAAVYREQRAVTNQLAADVMAGIVVATLEAAITHWAAQSARRSLQTHVKHAFAVLDTLAPTPARLR